MTDKPLLHGPYFTDRYGTFIYGRSDKDNGDVPVLEVRGWGYLTGNGHGALKQDPGVARAAQLEFAERVVAALNKVEHDL